MNKSKKIVSLAILLVMAVFQLSFMSNVQRVAAGPLNLDNQEGMAPGSGQIDTAFGSNPDKDVREIIVSYVQIFLGLLGLIFVVLIIFAGYKYMMAAGDKGATEESLSQIKNAVIGLAIILAAYGIVIFVGNQINTATSSTTINSAFFDIFYV